MIPKTEVAGHLAMLLFSVLVAGSFSLGATIANDIDPLALTTLRFFLTAVIIGSAAWLVYGRPKGLTEAPWRYMILGGLFAGYFVLMFEGLKTATPVSTSAVFTLTPIVAAGFGYLLLRQITTKRMALALAIGAVGALWVIFRGDLGAVLAFELGRGEAVYFVGCVLNAAYAPMVRKLNRGEPTLVFTFGMLVAGFLCLVIVGGRSVVATDWLNLSPLVWGTIAYLTICASSMTFVLLQFATMRLPAAKVMAYTYLTPSVVILWEIARGNSAPPVLVMGGIGLTVLALYLLLRSDEASA